MKVEQAAPETATRLCESVEWATSAGLNRLEALNQFDGIRRAANARWVSGLNEIAALRTIGP